MHETYIQILTAPFVLEQGDNEYMRFRWGIDDRHRRIVNLSTFIFYAAEMYQDFSHDVTRRLLGRLVAISAHEVRGLAVPSYIAPEDVKRLLIGHTAVGHEDTPEFQRHYASVYPLGEEGENIRRVNLILR